MKNKRFAFISAINHGRASVRLYSLAAFLFGIATIGNAQVAGCPMFPTNNIWNTPVDTLPLDPNSTAYVNTIGTNRTVHADFGSGTWDGGPIGIPFITVPGSQPKVNVTFDYWDESDPGPYPIPPDAPIEGGPNSTGDRHVLVVDTDNCVLYELYYAFQQNNGSWTAGSGAIYDLNSHELRPAGWTSADAAGLPILPGLVRFDEVASGEINHAIRFTVPQTRRAYVWPARHYASSLTGTQYPPMGQRFRLKASFDISPFSTEVQVILRALKKYGMILADNGSAWYISGAPDERWDNDVLHELGSVRGSAFEAVDVSSLMIDANSGQAYSVTNSTPPPPPPPTTITTDDSDPGIIYVGSWGRNSSSEAYGGHYRLSTKRNASVRFTFTGTNATWIAARGPKNGKATVSVDGVVVSTNDLYSAKKEWQYRIPISGLANTNHTVQITVLGLRNASSRGNTVVFDGFSVP